MIPKDNKTYKLKEYWDSRFEQEAQYDWLASYKQISQILEKYVNKQDKILLVGCGNSTLGPDMHKDGYSNIISSDFSDIVINKQKEQFPDMNWIVSDVKNLKEFENEKFDVIFDKATMDALVTDEGSQWNPNPETIQDCELMCKSVFRCLKPKGLFIQITFQDPYFRKKYIENPQIQWKLTNYEKIDCGLGYHFFVLQKY